jgi:hypothetical protein
LILLVDSLGFVFIFSSPRLSPKDRVTGACVFWEYVGLVIWGYLGFFGRFNLLDSLIF